MDTKEDVKPTLNEDLTGVVQAGTTALVTLLNQLMEEGKECNANCADLANVGMNIGLCTMASVAASAAFHANRPVEDVIKFVLANLPERIQRFYDVIHEGKAYAPGIGHMPAKVLN